MIPQTNSTLDIQAFAREVIQRLDRLEKQYVPINGSKLYGAQDADTLTGLTTLRQLNGVESRGINDINNVLAIIKQLKVDNGLK